MRLQVFELERWMSSLARIANNAVTSASPRMACLTESVRKISSIQELEGSSFNEAVVMNE
jgi:hypothetical protein